MKEYMNNELSTIDWAGLRHAYGPATDAPEHIQLLTSANHQEREKAYDWMYSAIVHQGTRWEASPSVARCVAELAATPLTPDRAQIFELLAALALGNDGDFLPGGVPIEKMRAEATRAISASDEELLRELDTWVADAPTEIIRNRRASLADVKKRNLDLELRRLPVWRVQSYDAVRWGVPNYYTALDDKDSEVRMRVAYLLGWFPENAETIAPRLMALVRREVVPVAKATACIAVGSVVGRDNGPFARELSGLLVHNERIVRWGAAIGLSVAGSTISDSTVKLLNDCVANSDAEPYSPPYFDGDMRAMAAQLLAKLD